MLNLKKAPSALLTTVVPRVGRAAFADGIAAPRPTRKRPFRVDLKDAITAGECTAEVPDDDAIAYSTAQSAATAIKGFKADREAHSRIENVPHQAAIISAGLGRRKIGVKRRKKPRTAVDTNPAMVGVIQQFPDLTRQTAANAAVIKGHAVAVGQANPRCVPRTLVMPCSAISVRTPNRQVRA